MPSLENNWLVFFFMFLAMGAIIVLCVYKAMGE